MVIELFYQFIIVIKELFFYVFFVCNLCQYIDLEFVWEWKKEEEELFKIRIEVLNKYRRQRFRNIKKGGKKKLWMQKVFKSEIIRYYFN